MKYSGQPTSTFMDGETLEAREPASDAAQHSATKQTAESDLERDHRRRVAREEKFRQWRILRGWISRPLEVLAEKEKELEKQSAALAKDPTPRNKRPDPNLIAYQVRQTIEPAIQGHQRTAIVGDALSLFHALRSVDAMESMVDRMLVGLNNTAMDCLARAFRTGNERARDINIRGANKSAKTFLELAMWRQARRRRELALSPVKSTSLAAVVVRNDEPKNG
jgi:hypothetical protein